MPDETKMTTNAHPMDSYERRADRNADSAAMTAQGLKTYGDAVQADVLFRRWYRIGEADARAGKPPRSLEGDELIAYEIGFTEAQISIAEWEASGKRNMAAEIAARDTASPDAVAAATRAVEIAERIADEIPRIKR